MDPYRSSSRGPWETHRRCLLMMMDLRDGSTHNSPPPFSFAPLSVTYLINKTCLTLCSRAVAKSRSQNYGVLDGRKKKLGKEIHGAHGGLCAFIFAYLYCILPHSTTYSTTRESKPRLFPRPYYIHSAYLHIYIHTDYKRKWIFSL